MQFFRAHARRFTAFSVVGALVFLLGELILFVGVKLGMGVFWAFASQAVISIEVSYAANWKYVFRKGESFLASLLAFRGQRPLKHKWRVLKRSDAWATFWKFNSSRGVMIPVDQALFVFLVWLGVQYLLANVVETALVTIVNYIVSWLWSFRQHKPHELTAGKQDVHTPRYTELPPVAVVVPVKERQHTIRPCVESLLMQYHPAEVILVGDAGDGTWSAIQDYIRAGQVTALEAVVTSVARDANAKRNIGLGYAREHGYEVFALTDSDMVLPPDWTATGASLVQGGWQCVAGPMQSVDTGFWPDYIDKSPILPKTPRMSPDYVVTGDNFGRKKPPITANVFFTRKAYDLVGGLDPDFVRDYEDYEFFARMASAGVDILCTQQLASKHQHRGGLLSLAKDYVATGWGCADFVAFRSSSPFAKQRLHQITFLRTAGIVVPLSIAALFAVLPSAWLGVVVAGIAAYGLAATYSVAKVHALKAALFPLITGFLLVAFLQGFARGRAFNRTGPHKTTVEAVTPLEVRSLGGSMTTTTVQHPQHAHSSLLRQVPYGLFVVAIAALGGLLRFWQIGARPGWDWDEPVYANIAGNVANHGSLMLKPQFGTLAVPWLFHPPFHFLLVGGWFKLAGVGITQARVWGATMALVALVLLFFMLREMIGKKWVLAVPALLAIDAWMIYANRVSSIENTLMVFVVLSIWLYWRAMQQPTTARFVLAGAVLGASTVYKFTGAYVVVAVLINWLIQRRQKLSRQHLLMLAATATVVAAYLGIMTLIYWKGGNDYFWKDNWVQLQRTLALHGSRGNINNMVAMVSPLVHQYRIFVGTILVAVASTLLVGWRLIQSFRAHSWQPVKQHSVLFAWVLASVISFGSIGLKFPTYFQLLLVPMYVYVVIEMGEKLVDKDVKQYARVLLGGALAGLVALSLLGFQWRIVNHGDNVMKSAEQYIALNIPRTDVVLSEEPVGVMASQQYCNLYRAGACREVASYIITYSSRQHPVPSNAVLRQLLARSKEVKTFTGFKETVTIWRIQR